MDDEKYIKKDNIYVSITQTSSIIVSIGNFQWLVFPDNGYIDNNTYYPLVKLSSLFSSGYQYGGSCEPTIDAIIEKAKECRNKFIGNIKIL